MLFFFFFTRAQHERKLLLCTARSHSVLLSLQALSSDGRVFSRAVSLLNIQPMLRLEYTASDLSTELLAAQQSSLEEQGVSGAQWDPQQGPVSGSLTVADLVVCNCVPGPVGSPATLLENLALSAREGGFVLLHTLLRGDTLGETVAFLTSMDNQNGLLSQVSGSVERLVKNQKTLCTQNAVVSWIM